VFINPGDARDDPMSKKLEAIYVTENVTKNWNFLRFEDEGFDFCRYRTIQGGTYLISKIFFYLKYSKPRDRAPPQKYGMAQEKLRISSKKYAFLQRGKWAISIVPSLSFSPKAKSVRKSRIQLPEKYSSRGKYWVKIPFPWLAWL